MRRIAVHPFGPAVTISTGTCFNSSICRNCMSIVMPSSLGIIMLLLMSIVRPFTQKRLRDGGFAFHDQAEK